MNIGERIKEARKTQALTQKQLAQKMGVAEVTIRQYESGKRALSLEQLEKIALALDAAITFFIDGSGVSPVNEFELICDTLNEAGYSIDQSNMADEYYIAPLADPDDPETMRRVEYSRLAEIVHKVLADAELKKKEYIKKRLDAELF
ncbi:MAG: helix-turn-helix transcriptional regulator [Treponema sp.]|nr:helix-turn-helix transcriptional regulator [Treponema sp.]